MENMNTSCISYELRSKQWAMQRRIKEELKDPNFLNNYTRKTLREVMVILFPYETMVNSAGRAFIGMTKARMYRHLQGYAILKGWKYNLK